MLLGLSKEEKRTLSQGLYASHHHKSMRETSHRTRMRLKNKVLSYYSSGKPVCARCGFDDIRALSIDHINSNGGVHRKELSRSARGSGFYWWLKLNGFPDGYQVLCMNCQWIKRTEQDECHKDLIFTED